MYSFLAGLSSHALRRIRRLTVSFPPISDIDEQPDWAFWQSSIQILANKATLPSLALTVEIGDCLCKHKSFAREEHFMTEKELQMLQVYEEVVRPLIQLRGRLKLLFLYVLRPFGIANEEARAEVERGLEQMVMGSGYNAYWVGKPPPDYCTCPFICDR
ncbi:hypothetical protein GQ44DRAFT_795038 [Phaeosphaeriaceae sp. PMI808]|nr:hypothetical protein GQ44DRAFT_795038 [Phaeosphaeriaceae sp. PMI808]